MFVDAHAIISDLSDFYTFFSLKFSRYVCVFDYEETLVNGWCTCNYRLTDSRGQISVNGDFPLVPLVFKRKEKCPKHHVAYSRSQSAQASTVQADLQQLQRQARRRGTRRTQAWAARGTGRT